MTTGTAPPAAVVLDHTALLLLGAGNRMLSGLVAAAHGEPRTYVYVPALCLTAAVTERPALAEHVGRLPALIVVDLDYPAAAATGAAVSAGVSWRDAYAVTTARPTVDWPNGRAILTSVPSTYSGWTVEVISVA